MRRKNWQVFAASALFVAMLAGFGQKAQAACAVEVAAERIAGFHPGCSVAVEQAVDLLRQGNYSLALLRLNTESKDVSVHGQARVFGAYALLVAGNSLGVFPQQGQS